jgi:hypothetical protein
MVAQVLAAPLAYSFENLTTNQQTSSKKKAVPFKGAARYLRSRKDACHIL